MMSNLIMKAVRFHKFGGPSVLQIDTNVPKPTILNHQVLINVKVAGINPVETYFREGIRNPNLALPHILGTDGAGVVEEIGKDIKEFKVGQRVLFCALNTTPKHGSYSEYTAVDENEVWPLHDRLSFSQGAAIGVPYMTAYRAIVIKGEAKKGDIMLIHGASGAVGLAAVQIGVNLGLTVIGTAGTQEGIELVKQNGADHVFCHRDEGYLEQIKKETQNKGVNLIIEMLANVNLGNDLPILAPRGKVMIVGSRGQVTINPRDTMALESSIVGVMLYANMDEETASMKKYFIEGIEQGWVKPVIGQEYPMSEAAKAHNDIIHNSGSKGKLVLVIE